MNLSPLLFLLPLLPLWLSACAAPPAPPVTAAPPALDAAALRRESATLPGAVAAVGEPLRLSYPGEALFAAGAALPLPGGTALLDPLADFLLSHPEALWTGTVRAAAGVSPEYDAALAQKRQELLERFFRNKGIAAERLQLAVATGEGAPLELVLATGTQSRAASLFSSAGAKP